MAILVSATRLRDELTDLWHLISRGRSLVVDGANRPAMLLRPLQGDDRGIPVTITRFRRQLHRVLREAQLEPIIVTSDGYPCFWVGRFDEGSEAADDQRELPDR